MAVGKRMNNTVGHIIQIYGSLENLTQMLDFEPARIIRDPKVVLNFKMNE